MIHDAYRHPPIEPHAQGLLEVDPLHRVAWEESGRRDGLPLLEIHGGPGVGTVPEFRRLYDPRRFRIVAFDQRGCGRSRPLAELRDNSTWHLVADIEALREHLGIERWILSGWSWGTTLALAYAQRHPERVLAIVLRGAWTALAEEAEWFEHGMHKFFPDTVDRLAARWPGVPREDLLAELFRRAMDETLSPDQREAAAADYGRYELHAAYLEATEEQIAHDLALSPQLPVAMIGAHYWQQRWFLAEGQLWRDLPRITHLPCTLIHGRYDIVAVPGISYRLHRAWPGSELLIVPRSGHMSSEPAMVAAIGDATDRLADRLGA